MISSCEGSSPQGIAEPLAQAGVCPRRRIHGYPARPAAPLRRSAPGRYWGHRAHRSFHCQARRS